MYSLNKIVWALCNPLTVALLLGLAGLLLPRRWVFGLSLALLWFASTLTCVRLLGLPLERPYLATQAVESLPSAGAIVLLGGGVGKTDSLVYPDMFEGADRVWHAARLWKAGKAPRIVVSGNNDLVAVVPLLLDLGVSREAIVVDNESRNTYENSRFTEKLILSESEGSSDAAVRRILLVTSAWHMPRALGNFSRTTLEAVPAAADYSANNACRSAGHVWDWVLPSADSLQRTSYLFKEWLGRLARK